MSDSQEQPWSDNPNAPKIPYYLYFEGAADFAGVLISSILYGMLIVLFFQCVAALLNPVNRAGGVIKWGLVSYTVAMFSFVTVLNGVGLDIRSTSYIDNREFPGVEGVLPPGPFGYQLSTWSRAITITASPMFLLNYWLADGLLLYRCYVIYSMNIWIIAFPCFMYLASVVTGALLFSSQVYGRSGFWATIPLNFSIPNASISVSLNVLLTLLIVIRLVLHGRNIRSATASPAGTNGLYMAIVTMLIESSALYSVNSLLLIILWAAENSAGDIFLSVVSETQVIAPLLIIKRVANRRALTSNTTVTGDTSLFHARSWWESTGDRDIPPGHDGDPIGSADNYEKNSDELGVEATIGFHRDSNV